MPDQPTIVIKMQYHLRSYFGTCIEMMVIYGLQKMKKEEKEALTLSYLAVI
jgi:hypothetical protein